jgi:PHD/YefM family antitoxin component YafN of YafNO toxin-antitoxin module
MNSINISQLKTSPSKIINQAYDYPVAIEKRNKIQAYLVGKSLYEKIISYLENYIDKKAVGKTNFTKGKDFEKVCREIGI